MVYSGRIMLMGAFVEVNNVLDAVVTCGPSSSPNMSGNTTFLSAGP